ncbi:MAG: selenite/tellurite reduction operon rhodanese-like protein ExtH [Betaproteobacteria bacterium]
MDFLSHQKQRKRFLWQLVAVSMLLFLIPFSMNSCSNKSYDTPLTAQTSATLLSPETLKTWIDGGVVNSTGFDRVVILDVTSQATYSAGHIPGAQFVNSGDIYQVRQEGPATDVNMSLDGPHMDALIQKYGIDKNTTIVFTSGGSRSAGTVLSATRAYFTFRYWGFPKEKLKMLDGINFSWAAAYGLTTDVPPAPVSSTYSVKNNAALRTDLRASLADMINVAEGKVPNAVPIDMRSSAADGSYVGKRGSTTGVFNPGGDYVAFEGHVKGGKALLYTDMFDSANNYRFKSPDVLAAMFNAVGIDGTKYTHAY